MRTTTRDRFTNDDVDYYDDIQWATHRGSARVSRLTDGRIKLVLEDEEITVICKDIKELNKQVKGTNQPYWFE